MDNDNKNPINPHSLLSLTDDKQEEIFNSLSLLEQVQVCLMCPWEKRIQFFLISHNLSEIIQSFPNEELFWTIKSSSPDDTLLILPHISAEQLQFCLDLEWWYKQDIRVESIASWLFLLFEADENALISWLTWISKEDDALIPLILRQFIKVQKRPDDMDIMEARDVLYGYTLEDTYFIDFKSEKLAPLFDRFLRILFEFSPEYYFGVMDSILWETNIEQLERSFKYRNNRLADFGIPNYYEAIEILTPLPMERVRKIPSKLYEANLLNSYFSPPFIPTLYKGDFPALNQALEPLYGKSAMERIINEWIGVANKFIIATLNDFNDPKTLEKTLLGVGALLNLGIIIQSQREKKGFSEIVEFSILEDLVRLTMGRLIQLRKKINSFIRDGLLPYDLSYLPDTWTDIISSLKKIIPMYFDGKDELFFSDTSQIEKCENIIEDIHVMAKIMSEVNPHWKNWEFEIDFRGTNLMISSELLWDTALLTGFANVSLYGVFKIIPVPEFEIPNLRDIWFSDGIKTVPNSTLNLGLSILGHIMEKHNLSHERVRKIVNNCFEGIRYEWENITEPAVYGSSTSKIIIKFSR